MSIQINDLLNAAILVWYGLAILLLRKDHHGT